MVLALLEWDLGLELALMPPCQATPREELSVLTLYRGFPRPTPLLLITYGRDWATLINPYPQLLTSSSMEYKPVISLNKLFNIKGDGLM